VFDSLLRAGHTHSSEARFDRRRPPRMSVAMKKPPLMARKKVPTPRMTRATRGDLPGAHDDGVKPGIGAPRDTHCEVSEGAVGHPVHVPGTRLVPRHRGALRDDPQDRPPRRRAPRSPAGRAATSPTGSGRPRAGSARSASCPSAGPRDTRARPAVATATADWRRLAGCTGPGRPSRAKWAHRRSPEISSGVGTFSWPQVDTLRWPLTAEVTPVCGLKSCG